MIFIGYNFELCSLVAITFPANSFIWSSSTFDSSGIRKYSFHDKTVNQMSTLNFLPWGKNIYIYFDV